MSNFKSKPTSIAKVYVRWGRIADSSRHPQPRPSLHQVWHIRASMFNQDQPHDSRMSPLYFRVKPRLCHHAVSTMGRHGGGDSKYLGKVHRILLILWFISFGKEKVLSYRIYSEQTGCMVACEPQMYYLSSLLSFKKQIFAEKQRPEICLRFTS